MNTFLVKLKVMEKEEVMNKKEFLKKLKNATNDDAIVSYYDELISDRTENGEDEAAVVSGYDIQKIVKGLEFKTAKEELYRSKHNKIWVVVLALCSTPVTIPLAISFVAIVFSLFVVGISLIVAGVAGSVWTIIGVVELIVLGESFAFILLNLAGGLLALGIVGIMGYYGINGIISFYNWLVVKFFKYSRKNKEVKL